MSKVAVVYWSGTGNTEAMAQSVAAGAQGAGAEVTCFGPSEFDLTKMGQFDAVAFGCPSMGAEVLEEMEFEPMFAALESGLVGKKIALFGSWGWGGGVWMNDWEARCLADGAVLAHDCVTCMGAPDDDATAQCMELGAALA